MNIIQIIKNYFKKEETYNIPKKDITFQKYFYEKLDVRQKILLQQRYNVYISNSSS